MGPLRQAGVAADSVVWEDPYVEWSAYELLVIRSTWDYAYRLEQFLDWLDRAARQVPLWNPPPVVRANAHKGYLRDLERAGVPVIPTRYLPAGSPPALGSVLEELSPQTGLVVKPAVGNSGRWTVRVLPDHEDIRTAEARIERILAHEEMMAQPFLPSVAESGEISLVGIAGEITHAVRKTPAEGEFRVHIDYGGSETRTDIPDELARLMEMALGMVGETLYARADFVAGPGGGPVLIEFELVEPDLFLRHSPDTANRLARAIIQRL